MQKRLFSALIALGGVLSCNSEAETPEQRCHRVLERVISLEIRADHPKRDEHSRVMRRAMRDTFVKRCTRDMSASQRDCVLEARNAKKAFECTLPQTHATSKSTRGE